MCLLSCSDFCDVCVGHHVEQYLCINYAPTFGVNVRMGIIVKKSFDILPLVKERGLIFYFTGNHGSFNVQVCPSQLISLCIKSSNGSEQMHRAPLA
jgi:hypothetical protein